VDLKSFGTEEPGKRMDGRLSPELDPETSIGRGLVGVRGKMKKGVKKRCSGWVNMFEVQNAHLASSRHRLRRGSLAIRQYLNSELRRKGSTAWQI